MKDYTIFSSKSDSEKFILNYKIIRNQIVITYANRKKYSYPFSTEKEAEILNIMKEQAKSSKPVIIEANKEIRQAVINMLIIAICITANIYYVDAIAPVMCRLSIFMCSYASLINIATIIYGKKVESDIKKNGLFLNEAAIINANIRQPIIIEKTSKKIKEMITNESKNKPALNINTIDKLTLAELKETSLIIHYYLQNSKSTEEFGKKEALSMQKKRDIGANLYMLLFNLREDKKKDYTKKVEYNGVYLFDSLADFYNFLIAHGINSDIDIKSCIATKTPAGTIIAIKDSCDYLINNVSRSKILKK